MSAWDEDERKRIELYRSGWSVTLIAEYRKESLATVQRSVNKLLELLGEKQIEVKDGEGEKDSGFKSVCKIEDSVYPSGYNGKDDH